MSAADYFVARKAPAAELFELPDVHVITGLLSVSLYKFPALSIACCLQYFDIKSILFEEVNDPEEGGVGTITMNNGDVHKNIFQGQASVIQRLCQVVEDRIKTARSCRDQFYAKKDLEQQQRFHSKQCYDPFMVDDHGFGIGPNRSSDEDGSSYQTGCLPAINVIRSNTMRAPFLIDVTSLSAVVAATAVAESSAALPQAGSSSALSQGLESLHQVSSGGGSDTAAGFEHLGDLSFEYTGSHTFQHQFSSEAFPAVAATATIPLSETVEDSPTSEAKTSPIAPLVVHLVQVQSVGSSSLSCIDPVSPQVLQRQQIFADYIRFVHGKRRSEISAACERIRRGESTDGSSHKKNEVQKQEIISETDTSQQQQQQQQQQQNASLSKTILVLNDSNGTVAHDDKTQSESQAATATTSSDLSDEDVARMVGDSITQRSRFWHSREGSEILFLLSSNSSRVLSLELCGCGDYSNNNSTSVPFSGHEERYHYSDNRLVLFLLPTTPLGQVLNALSHNRRIVELVFRNLDSLSDAFVVRLCEIEMDKAENSVVQALLFHDCRSLTDISAGALHKWLTFVREESVAFLKGSLRHVVYRGTSCPWSKVMYDAIQRECVAACNLSVVRHADVGTNGLQL